MADNIDKSDSKSNVKDISKAKLKQIKEESSKEEKIHQSEIYHLWLGIISGKLKNFPKFPLNLIVCLDGDSEFVFYKFNDKKICFRVSDEFVASSIKSYSEINFLNSDMWIGGGNKSKDLAQYCKVSMEISPKPASFAFKNQDKYCMHKLDFDPSYSITETLPLFEEFLSRMSNKDAFIRYIGSLFFEQSRRQQYLWLYGDGQNGKGSFARLLSKIFGPAYKSLEQKPSGDASRFWNTQLLDCRVGVFEDNNATSFITTGWFKSLTGEDQVVIEKKKENQYSANINTKFIILSNEKPNLSSEKADLRRIIFCELKNISSDPAMDYEDLLWSEAPGIIGHCIQEYASFIKDCGGAVNIPVEESSMLGLSSQEDDRFESIFYDSFDNSSPSYECTRAEFGQVMLRHFGTKNSHYGMEGKFRLWLERTKGVQKFATKRDGKNIRGYSGIKRKFYTP